MAAICLVLFAEQVIRPRGPEGADTAELPRSDTLPQIGTHRVRAPRDMALNVLLVLLVLLVIYLLYVVIHPERF